MTPVDRGRRMRITATAMLVAMAAVFLAARQFEGLHPAVGYVIAFAEAAMVPHTAIIPEKKDRIADTMAGFLRDNFLTPTVVARRMRDMNFARAAGEFLVRPRGAERGRIGAGAVGLLAEMLESLDPERLGNQVRAGLARQAERIDLAPLLGSMLAAAIADGRHRPLIDGAARWAGMALEQNEELVRKMIHERANALLRWTGLDERLANSVLDGLYRLLAEVLVDQEHPLRLTVEEILGKLAHDLQHDPETREKVEAQIVQLVSETVRRWDARTVTSRIESAVGRDLQFIRINGTLVGGLVGVTIHFIDSLL